MDRIGSAEIWDGYAKSPDEMMVDLNSVTKEAVEKLAAEFFVRPLTFGLAGPKDSFNSEKLQEFERLLS